MEDLARAGNRMKLSGNRPNILDGEQEKEDPDFFIVRSHVFGINHSFLELHIFI